MIGPSEEERARRRAAARAAAQYQFVPYFQAEFEHSPYEWGTEEWAQDEMARYRDIVSPETNWKEMERGYQYRDFMKQAQEYMERAKAWRAHQEQTKREMLPGMRGQMEQAAARALGGTLRGRRLSTQRAGLGRGGLAGRGMAEAETGVRGMAAASFMDASSRFLQQQAAERGQFIMQETAFENQMSLMQQDYRLQEAMEKRLLNFQANLQADLQSRNAFYDVAGAIGGFIGMGVPQGWIGRLF